MTSKPWAWIKGLETVGLCFGSVHNFPHTDSHFVTEHGQFIDQTDIDIAICILQNFFHFRNGWRRHLIYIPLQNSPVHGGDHLGCILPDCTDNLGSILGFINQIAGINAFWGKSQVKIFPTFQAGAFLQNWFNQFFGCSWICGRLQNDHSFSCKIFGNLCGRSSYKADIWLLVGI